MTTQSPRSHAVRVLAASSAIIATLAFSACNKKEATAAAPAPAPAPTQAAAPAAPAAAPATTTAAPAFASAEQQVSYGIGFNMASNLSRQPGFTPDRAALIAGIEDALSGAKQRIEEKDLQAAFGAIEQKARAAAEETAKANIAVAEKFLEENKKKAGVKTTASGLQYEIVKSGTGAKPTATDRVSVHYTGTLIDGKVFDSSVERGEPITFAVGGVIPGWTEALQLMSVGDKWKLYIPANLAYGARGAGGDIPPNSALIFDVELLAIEAAPPTPPPAPTPEPTPAPASK